MFAFTNISRFQSQREAYKILQSALDVIIYYLVIFLVTVSLLFAGIEVTSGGFQCLPAVDCPGMSKSNASGSLLSHLKHPNVCEKFYSSQKTNVIKRTDVVSDLKTTVQYTNFVNSQCSKGAVPNFLAYFSLVLFIQASFIIVLDNLWLKLPTTASIIEHFLTLVTECYTSPCPNFALKQALLNMPARQNGKHKKDEDSAIEEQPLNPEQNNNDNNGYDSDSDSEYSRTIDFSGDPATINAVKTLYEKAHMLKSKLKSSNKVWILYLLQATLQLIFTTMFLFIDIYFLNDLKETIRCKVTQHIPVPHDYFICSHYLASTFLGGLIIIYLPVLSITLVCFAIKVLWLLWFMNKGNKGFEYMFNEKTLPEIKLFDVPSVSKDFGFLLHLLDSYDKLYVLRLAYFLSKRNKKKFQAYLLKKDFPVAALEKQLGENGNKLSFSGIQGIPETIFNVAPEVVELELMDCELKNNDFENLDQLTSLRTISVINCRLESIPEGVLKLDRLEKLCLKGNLLKSVSPSISRLENLASLDLSGNHIKTIDGGSIENNPNLLVVNLSGNTGLTMTAVRTVLACKKLETFHPPQHVTRQKDELDDSHRATFDKVSICDKGDLVTAFKPDVAPSFDLTQDKIYKMDSSPKGIAIIINNYSFQNNAYPRRTGTQKDVSLLTTLFKNIGFDVQTCINEKANAVKEFLKAKAKDKRYKECDCIAVIMMSYGDKKGVVFSDCEVVCVTDLVECLQSSPFYREKPKLFFVQAVSPFPCQSASPNVMVESPIIEEADILLSYSTMDRPVSSRNSELGSWYIQELFDTFRQHACKEDIESLLTLVKYKVVRNCNQARWKQVPPPQSTLKKKLFLLPGYSATPHSIEPLGN